jgi:hypothetical protein
VDDPAVMVWPRLLILLALVHCGGQSPGEASRVIEIPRANSAALTRSQPTVVPKTVHCEVVSETVAIMRCVRSERVILDKSMRPQARIVRENVKTRLDLRELPRAIGVRAESRSFIVEGELARDATWLYLRSQASALSSHISLWKGAPVRLNGASVDGVSIRAYLGIRGLENIDTVVPCGDLTLEATPIETPDGPKGISQDNYGPSSPSLSLFASPNGVLLATVEDGAPTLRMDPPVERIMMHAVANLTVHDKRASFSRVTFDTSFARFNAWVRDAEIAIAPPRGFGGGRGCSSSRRKFKGKRGVAATDVPLRVGETAEVSTPSTIRLKAGVIVTKYVTGAGRIGIEADEDALEPPEGMTFYADESALNDAPDP